MSYSILSVICIIYLKLLQENLNAAHLPRDDYDEDYTTKPPQEITILHCFTCHGSQYSSCCNLNVHSNYTKQETCRDFDKYCVKIVRIVDTTGALVCKRFCFHAELCKALIHLEDVIFCEECDTAGCNTGYRNIEFVLHVPICLVSLFIF